MVDIFTGNVFRSMCHEFCPRGEGGDGGCTPPWSHPSLVTHTPGHPPTTKCFLVWNHILNKVGIQICLLALNLNVNGLLCGDSGSQQIECISN